MSDNQKLNDPDPDDSSYLLSKVSGMVTPSTIKAFTLASAIALGCTLGKTVGEMEQHPTLQLPPGAVNLGTVDTEQTTKTFSGTKEFRGDTHEKSTHYRVTLPSQTQFAWLKSIQEILENKDPLQREKEHTLSYPEFSFSTKNTEIALSNIFEDAHNPEHVQVLGATSFQQQLKSDRSVHDMVQVPLENLLVEGKDQDTVLRAAKVVRDFALERGYPIDNLAYVVNEELRVAPETIRLTGVLSDRKIIEANPMLFYQNIAGFFFVSILGIVGLLGVKPKKKAVLERRTQPLVDIDHATGRTVTYSPDGTKIKEEFDIRALN